MLHCTKMIDMLHCTKDSAVTPKANWPRHLAIKRIMPTVHTSPRALEAVAAPQTSTDTPTKVTHKSAETAQQLVEQAVRAVHTAVQRAGQNFDLAVQLTGTAVSSSQA